MLLREIKKNNGVILNFIGIHWSRFLGGERSELCILLRRNGGRRKGNGEGFQAEAVHLIENYCG